MLQPIPKSWFEDMIVHFAVLAPTHKDRFIHGMYQVCSIKCRNEFLQAMCEIPCMEHSGESIQGKYQYLPDVTNIENRRNLACAHDDIAT